MANYIFETATDASNFASTDHLIFASTTPSMVSATDAAAFTDALGNHAESITLTANDHSLTFSAADLSAASVNGHIAFLNSDSLVVGTAAADTLTINDVGHGHNTVIYGFDGNDVIHDNSASNDIINGGAGDDVITGSSSYTDATGHYVETDFYQGGAGADTITGGDGNDHIYGNVAVGSAGMPDGADSIAAGDGNDYVNGNAGNDRIEGQDGNDRLYGGNGIDQIFGGNGNDYVQGNQGDDGLEGNDGNDTVHGGAGNDSVSGNDGDDQLWGDLGNDSLHGGNGNDVLHGGLGADVLEGDSGNDIFAFAVGDASPDPTYGLGDYVSDFEDGSDHISLGFTVSAVLHGQPGLEFTDFSAATTYAQSLLAGTDGTAVAAVTYTDNHSAPSTLLFWNDTHSSATINSSIYILDVTDDKINVGTHSDFI